jgi:hypothetical protein
MVPVLSSQSFAMRHQLLLPPELLLNLPISGNHNALAMACHFYLQYDSRSIPIGPKKTVAQWNLVAWWHGNLDFCVPHATTATFLHGMRCTVVLVSRRGHESPPKDALMIIAAQPMA